MWIIMSPKVRKIWLYCVKGYKFLKNKFPKSKPAEPKPEPELPLE